mgnify:CR=1 FL=1
MFQFLEAAGIALDAIWSNKLRSFMTVLGNIVAVTSIIAVVSLIQGINASVNDAIVGRYVFLAPLPWAEEVLAFLVMCIVALLYYATPNIQQPKFRWISVGAAVAIVIWILASVAFALYVGTFGSRATAVGGTAASSSRGRRLAPATRTSMPIETNIPCT